MSGSGGKLRALPKTKNFNLTLPTRLSAMTVEELMEGETPVQPQQDESNSKENRGSGFFIHYLLVRLISKREALVLSGTPRRLADQAIGAILVDDGDGITAVTSSPTSETFSYLIADYVPKEIVSLLNNMAFFASLDNPEFIEKIAKIVLLRKFQTGDVIIRQGDAAKGMFFIVKGTLKVISDDGEIELAELSSGSYCKALQ